MNRTKIFTRRVFVSAAAAAASIVIAGRKLFGPIDPPVESLDLSSRKKDLATDDPVVSAAIYPAIGVARVGNSLEKGNDFFDGPEVDTQLYSKDGKLRDSLGALKRQAQRFRIYGKTKSGKTIELNTDNAEIQWKVQLANKKASWYRFDTAMDLSEVAEAQMKLPLRNPDVRDRESLMIRPSVRSVSGANADGEKFDDQKFMGIPVCLGELRTDEKGRLRVLGGLGKAGTPDPKKFPIFKEEELQTFNNADGWYDDTSDGPVHAQVKVNGLEIPVASAWVIVAPPNYAPDLVGFRTLYDLMLNLFLEKKPEWISKRVEKTSFTANIMPLFKRLANLQWVNQGFSDTFNFTGSFNFDDVSVLRKLASNTNDAKADRQKIFNYFRIPEMDKSKAKNQKLWPMLYGDAYGSYEDSDQTHFYVAAHQAQHLKNWLNGDFVNDFDPAFKMATSLDEVALDTQPDMLTKAALDFCLADAFHPGCEATWPLRHIATYSDAFRINERTDSDTWAQNPNSFLNWNDIVENTDPLQKQGAGDLTRWMALPWHGDTTFCRSGYEPEIDPFLPTFWPARVPNQVLTEEAYQTVMNTELPFETRKAAFLKREHWLRVLTGSAPMQMQQMVDHFGDIGVIEARPGPSDGKFPGILLVENLGKFYLQPRAKGGMGPVTAGKPRSLSDPKSQALEKAGWESAEQLESFRRIRFHKSRGK
jgi:hypothetical protein